MRRLGLAVLLGAATIGCSIGLMGTAGWLLARGSEHPRLSELTLAIVGVRALGTFRGVLRYAERLVSHDAVLRMTAALRVNLVERLASLSPWQLESQRSGDLLQRVVRDVDELDGLYLRALNPLAVAALTGLATTVVTGVMVPAAGVILALGLLLAGGLVPALTARLGLRSGAALMGARARHASEVIDLVQGAPELAVYGNAEQHLARLRATDAELAMRERWDAMVGGLGGAAAVAISGATVAGVLAVVISAANSGTASIGLVAVLGLVALASFEAVTPLPTAWAQLGSLRAAASRVHSAFRSGPGSARSRERCQGQNEMGWLEGGPCVALVGMSGAGKTQLARTLVESHDGIGMMEQHPYLFHTTIRNNILLARPDATDEELAHVADLAGLRDWIAQLPHGWDTPVGEAGGLISGGECRLIALARVLLARHAKLILDEPTIDLDPATAHSVLHRVLADARERQCGVLLITHREEDLAHEYIDDVVRLRVITPTELTAS